MLIKTRTCQRLGPCNQETGKKSLSAQYRVPQYLIRNDGLDHKVGAQAATAA